MPLKDDIRLLLKITVHNGALLEAEKATITFQQLVERLRASGMNDLQIRERVLRDFADENSVYFGAYKNQIKELVAGAIHQGYELGVVSVYAEDFGDEHQMKWTTVGDDNSCDDCNFREGEVRTLGEWKLIGLPKSGFSRCGLRCRCEITPVEVNAPARMAA